MNMFKGEKVIDARGQTLIQDPPIARFFFQSTIAAWLWLAVRIYVGYDFIVAGWHKFTTPAWMDGSGTGILGFWKGALGTTASGAPIITFDWYRSFLQHLVDTNSAGWFSYVIVFGELAVGIGLILGAFVGLAAAGGLLMNFAFLLAGTTSTNPVLVMLGFCSSWPGRTLATSASTTSCCRCSEPRGGSQARHRRSPLGSARQWQP